MSAPIGESNERRPEAQVGGVRWLWRRHSGQRLPVSASTVPICQRAESATGFELAELSGRPEPRW
jgi:hypothetical protein